MEASVIAICSVVRRPRSTCLPSSFIASPMPSSRALGAMSFMRTGTPREADWYEMPPPMMPAPSTAARLTGRAAFACLRAIFFTAWSPRKTDNQGASGLGLCHLRAQRGLDRHRLVTRLAGALLDRVDGGHRRRVVRPGLAGHEGLAAEEDHAGLDPVELQRGLLLLAARAPVELPVGRLLQHHQRRLAQVGGRGHRVDGSGLQRLLRAVLLAAGDPLDGDVGAGDARQAHGAAPAREDAELGLGQADLGLGRHHAVARGEAQLEAAAESDAVDRGDARRLEVLEHREDLLPVAQEAGDLLFAALEQRHELGDVGADDEDVLAARDQHAARRPLARAARRRPRQQAGERLLQLAKRRLVQLVDGVFLEIETQFDETAVEGKDLHGLSFEGHGSLLHVLGWLGVGCLPF